MAYKIKKQKDKKKYCVYNSYTGQKVFSSSSKYDAEEFLAKHRFRGDTSLRMKVE